MQHKNNINSSLLAITEQCKCISDSLKQKTDLELVDLAQSCSTQSASAKTLLIRRYLPKILKESNKKLIFARPAWKLISDLKPYKKSQKMNLSGAKEIYKRIINIPSSQSLILK